jgi:hypothetical protein
LFERICCLVKVGLVHGKFVAAVNMAITPMIDNPDIFRAAKLLIDRHDDDAPIRPAQRADELLKEGDTDGAVVWRRILKAIDELRRGRRDSADTARTRCFSDFASSTLSA